LVRQRIHRFFSGVPAEIFLLSSVAGVDAPLVQLVRRFQATASLREQLPIAEAVADHVIGVRGFFEWESPLGEVSP
jgi:hypothetical protein